MPTATLDKRAEKELQSEEAVMMFTKARKNMVNFRKILLDTGVDEVGPAQFHYEWSDILLEGIEHYAIEGYRESAKTQYVLRAFPLYCLTYPSPLRDYIVIIRNNATQAQNKLREIEDEFTTNPLLSLRVKNIKEQSKECFSVDVENDVGEIINVRIEAYGKGASIRGLSNIDRRPKVVIIDDPQDLEDMKSPTVLDNDWNWFLGDVMFLGQKTRIFLIGNNLGEACIIERVFANASQLKFRTKKIPELYGNIPSWPQKRSADVILREKEDYRSMGKLDVWLREKMCEAASEETRVIKKADFQHFSLQAFHHIMPDCNIFLTVDPASSKELSSCYRAIVTNYVSSDNYWYIPRIRFGRWDSVELLQNLFEEVRLCKNGPGSFQKVGFEKGMYKQIIEPYLQEKMVKENCFFDVAEVEHAKEGSKLQRVMMLAPRFRAHQIWFAQEGHDWLAEIESELLGVTKEGFKSLYTDLEDALAMQEQIANPPVSHRVNKHLPREAEL